MPGGAAAQPPVPDQEPAAVPGTGQDSPFPRRDNFWYGTTATEEGQPYFFSEHHKTFVSVEPMTGPLHPGRGRAADGLGDRRSGNREPEGKVTPERKWVEDLLDACREEGGPCL